MTQHKGKGTRVLIADDDFSIRQLVCTIVKREGLEVDCVADGAEAIEKLQEHEYAVVLLDLMMPRVDGFGVVEYLRHHPPTHKPVVLVVTAYADQKFKEVDPNIVSGVLRKPFEVAELGTVVRLCVYGFETETESAQQRHHTLHELTSRQWHVATAGDGTNGPH
ncbi:MAG TPA: response regulator [Thermoanaerobaculia bacterium]|nr:response regulator [Thermoanaerobaculia bacterium]